MEVSYENNPHGYGFMWIEQGRVNAIKGLCDFEQIWQVSKMLKGMTYALHLRWRTTGKISEEQCHPFTVLEKDKHGIDMMLMHNGTIFSMPHHPEKSDTQLFAEKLSTKIIDNDPKFRMNYFYKMDSIIGHHNKIVMLTSDNRTFFINKPAWKNIDGVMYSNTYSLQHGYRKNIMKKKEEKQLVLKVFNKNEICYERAAFVG